MTASRPSNRGASIDSPDLQDESDGSDGAGGSGGSDGPDGSTELTEDRVFDALANSRRRYTLRALSQIDDQFEIGQLAERVAAWENDATIEEISRSQRKSTYTSLQQLHLPKLDNLGLVEYDKQRGIVESKPAAAEVDSYFYDDEPEFRWSKYYLGLSVVLAMVVLLAWLNVFPFSTLSDIVWGALSIGLVAISAAVHYQWEHP